MARTPRPRRVVAVEESRPSRGVYGCDAVQHSISSVLSLRAAAFASRRAGTHERVDDARAGHSDHRDVQPGRDAVAMAIEMDFCLWSQLRRAAIRIERRRWKILAAVRSFFPRLLLHVCLHHRAD